MLSRRKGITPIIATIVLLLITMALLGAAWAFISGITATTRSCIQMPPGAKTSCTNGALTVYAYNCGTEAVKASSIDSVEINGFDVTGDIGSATIAPGKTGALIQGYGCDCGAGCIGKKVIRIVEGLNIMTSEVQCDEARPDMCTCPGTGYVTWTCQGQTIYVDCNADKCWTPYMTSMQWSTGLDPPGYDCQAADCTGEGAACPACNYCDTMSYGGFGPGQWKLPSLNELRSICSVPSLCTSATGACFGEVPPAFPNYFTANENGETAAKVVPFKGAGYCASGWAFEKSSTECIRCIFRT